MNARMAGYMPQTNQPQQPKPQAPEPYQYMASGSMPTIQGAPSLPSPQTQPNVDYGLQQGTGNPYDSFFNQIFGATTSGLGLGGGMAGGGMGSGGSPIADMIIPGTSMRFGNANAAQQNMWRDPLMTMANRGGGGMGMSPSAMGANGGMFPEGSQMPQHLQDIMYQDPSYQLPDPGGQGGQGGGQGGFGMTDVMRDPISLDPTFNQYQIDSLLNNALGNNAMLEQQGLQEGQANLASRGMQGTSPVQQGLANRMNLNRMMADTEAHRDIPMQAQQMNQQMVTDRMGALAQQRGMDINAWTSQQNAYTNALNPILQALMGVM